MELAPDLALSFSYFFIVSFLVLSALILARIFSTSLSSGASNSSLKGDRGLAQWEGYLLYFFFFKL